MNISDTVRTFIAIDLSPDVRAYLADCQARLKRAGGDVKWVRPELIHLTLVFLGDMPVESLADLEQAVRSVAAQAGPMTLQATGAGRFPSRGNPRTLWVGVAELCGTGGLSTSGVAGQTGSLVRLQKALADATAVFAEKVEDRHYEPHLTVGRAKSSKDALQLSQAVDAMAAEKGPSFEAPEVTIFKSVLSPQGPTYTALARVELGGA